MNRLRTRARPCRRARSRPPPPTPHGRRRAGLRRRALAQGAPAGQRPVRARATPTTARIPAPGRRPIRRGHPPREHPRQIDQGAARRGSHRSPFRPHGRDPPVRGSSSIPMAVNAHFLRRRLRTPPAARIASLRPVSLIWYSFSAVRPSNDRDCREGRPISLEPVNGSIVAGYRACGTVTEGARRRAAAVLVIARDRPRFAAQHFLCRDDRRLVRWRGG